MAEIVIPPGYVALYLHCTTTGAQHDSIMSLGGKVEAAPFTSANTNSCYTEWVNAIKAQHPATIQYPRLVALVGNDGPLIRYEVTGATVGTRVATMLCPPQVAGVTKKITAFGGRQYRGRLYFPGVAEAQVGDDGKWVAGELTAWQTAWNNVLINLVSVAGCNLSELSLLHAPPAGGGSPPLPTPVLSLGVGSWVGTQRRRLVRQ